MFALKDQLIYSQRHLYLTKIILGVYTLLKLGVTYLYLLKLCHDCFCGGIYFTLFEEITADKMALAGFILALHLFGFIGSYSLHSIQQKCFNLRWKCSLS